MADPAALREALADCEAFEFTDPVMSAVIAAARELLRRMETAETVWWCEEHGDTGNKDRCMWGNWDRADDGPCRMVEAVLTRREPAETPETEVEKNQIGMW